MFAIKTLQEEAILPYLEELAHLRISVFAQYPYLYQGDLEYEKQYLSAFANSENSTLLLAMVDQKVVGASTCMPLAVCADQIKAPFLKNKLALSAYCYWGESVLLPAYRGRGIGRAFFAKRIASAYSMGAGFCTFCAVERDPILFPAPDDYFDLTNFWRSEGFEKSQDLQTLMHWPLIGCKEDSAHVMRFWVKKLS